MRKTEKANIEKPMSSSAIDTELQKLMAEQLGEIPADGMATKLIGFKPVDLTPQADLVEKTKELLEVLPEPTEPLSGTLGRHELIFLDEIFQPGNPPQPDQRGTEDATVIAKIQEASAKVKSNGGSSSYYALPEGASQLNDLIEHKGMGFAVGEIFKATYRLGQKDGTDILYDLNKIVFYAQERLIPFVKKHGRLP
jgi:hypothetical protein